ncbi:MAG: alpha-2-macroglobulin family protein, partial [Bradymonadaceae bacterium]
MGAAAPADGPLEIVRKSPEGKVDVAPRLSVSFSHPMVAVGATGRARAANRPVELTPAVEGTWRWVGTKTLVFEPKDGRFPMATEYNVSVPEAVASVDGVGLEKGRSWTFTTPPVRVTRIHPTGRRPLMFMAFNQRIDPQKIIEKVKVWGGGEIYSTRLVARDRIEDDEQIRRLAEQTPEDQWIAFTVGSRLRPATKFQIGLEQGAPSAEGKRRTDKGQYETFETYSPLKIEDAGCRRAHRNECGPGQPWVVEFNNPLDPESVDASKVRVEPKLSGKEVEVADDRLLVRGESKGRRDYKLELAADIRDQYGQKLGRTDARTITIGSAFAFVYGPGSDRVTLDPTGPRTFPVHSINFAKLRVRAYRVQPSDWGGFLKVVGHRGQDETPPGQKVFDLRVTVDAEPDTYATTHIDLSEALDDGHGHVVLDIRGVSPQIPSDSNVGVANESFDVWVQSTDIGLDAYRDDQKMVAWATSLADGRPLEGVEIALTKGDETVTTGADGVAEVELPPDSSVKMKEGVHQQLIARQDVAFVPEAGHAHYFSSEWTQSQSVPESRWIVFDDRNLYRPGETMRLKGWFRVMEDSSLSIPDEGTSVSYRIVGPRGNEIASGGVTTDAHGGFDLTAEMPDDVNLGRARAEFGASVGEGTHSYNHRFRIQEFRTPSFEVGVESTSAGPHLVGESLEPEAEASYYAGGAVRGAEIDWTLQSSSTTYEPPGWSGFVFGQWQPWWIGPSSGESRTETFQGRTDGAGRHRLSIDLEGVTPPEPQQLAVDATVTDVNRQTVAGSKELLVHPSKMYVGLKTDRWFVEPDEPLAVDVVATRIDGTAVAGKKVTVRAERLEWRRRDGEWTEEIAETTTCQVETTEKPVTCELKLAKGGQWRIASRIEDEKGRPNRTRMNVWVPGGQRPTSEQLEREQVQLLPQKKSWKPGETAEVLVQAPFAGGEGLAVIQHGGVEKTKRFSMEGTSHTLEISVREKDIPNLHLRVDVNGSVARKTPETKDAGDSVEKSPDRPAFATGELELQVSRKSKQLGVELAPQSTEVAPGGEVEVGVEVTGPDGKPAAGSQVALVAVDEAVLAAADYELGDPLAALHPAVPSGVKSHHLRETVVLASLRQLAHASRDVPDAAMGRVARMEATGTARQAMAAKKSSGGSGAAGIDLRKDFRPLAHFASALETDAEGQATATIQLPDNLTRYRLMAVAVQGADKTGAGESQVTARLPLMVQPSMPRFLNWGDKADLPVVVRNQTDEKRTVQLAARSKNLKLTGTEGVQFEVPAGDRVEVQFPSETESPGRARLQFVARSGDWSDAAAVDFPVWTPATTEAFADYGVLDKGATSRRIEVPDGAVDEFGSLQVTTSPTALEQLTDAFIYLVDYPYDGAEQVASRLLSVSALRDVLGAFEAEGLPDQKKLDERVRRDVERLVGLQQPDGGFALWRPDGRSHPFVSVHAAHALVRYFHREDIEIYDESLAKARKYLRDIEDKLPDRWNAKVHNMVHAYALYVQQLMDAPEPGEVEALAGKSIGDELSLEAAAWLLSTLAESTSGGDTEKALREALLDRAVEEAGTAQFTTDYADDQGYLVMHSNRRADALALDALIRSAPKSDLIPKVVEGLMTHRTKGRWTNTQENVFVLLALQRYFATFEKEAPDFVSEMWLGDQYVGEHASGLLGRLLGHLALDERRVGVLV